MVFLFPCLSPQATEAMIKCFSTVPFSCGKSCIRESLFHRSFCLYQKREAIQCNNRFMRPMSTSLGTYFIQPESHFFRAAPVRPLQLTELSLVPTGAVCTLKLKVSISLGLLTIRLLFFYALCTMGSNL